MSKVRDVIVRQKTLRSLCALITISFWVHFLAASAPHRVHHLLENLPRRDLAPNQGLDKAKSTETVIRQAAGPAKRQAKPSRAHHHRDHGHDGHTHTHAHQHDHRHTPVTAVATINETDTAAAPMQTGAPRRDAHHDSSAQNDCLVQAAAQHTHIGQVACAEIVATDTAQLDGLAQQDFTFAYFDPSPFSQRAPPNP